MSYTSIEIANWRRTLREQPSERDMRLIAQMQEEATQAKRLVAEIVGDARDLSYQFGHLVDSTQAIIDRAAIVANMGDAYTGQAQQHIDGALGRLQIAYRAIIQAMERASDEAERISHTLGAHAAAAANAEKENTP